MKIPILPSIMWSLSLRMGFLSLVCLSAFEVAHAQAVISRFGPLGGGTFSWTDAGNWSNGVPGGTNAVAHIGGNVTPLMDFTEATFINLNGSRTLGSLFLGDSNGSHGITIQPGSGGTITFNSSFGEVTLNKAGGATDTISAPLIFSDEVFLQANAGTLILSGPVTIGGGTENYVQKTGGGTLTLTGPLIMNGPGIAGDLSVGLAINGGTTNIAGTGSSLNRSMRMLGGTLNFGLGTGSSSTTFVGTAGIIHQGGTVNFGVNTAADQPAPTNNVSINLDAISITAGTLNLRNGSGGGVTTLGLGTTGTLTLDGGTTAFFTTGGNAGGSFNIASGAKVTMNNDAVLNFSSTANANLTFASLTSASTVTQLRSQAGNGTFTLGGDGIDDFFNGQINLASSGGNSRIIKIGSETFTIGGDRDNSTARVDVKGGTVVLAKDSSALVAAIGSALIIGDDTPGEKVVRLGGTYTSAGNNIAANYTDQIFRTAVVTINATGVLDLNGRMESIDYMTGTGLITNRAAATLSTLIVGDNNFAFEGRTFAGTIQDGAAGARIGFVKTGDQTLTLTNAGSTFTGPSIFARGTTQLSGNGAFTGTETIGIERGATLLLNNDNTTVANRINNSATVAMNRGTLTLRGGVTANPNKVILEALGNLSLSSFNVVRLDNTGAGGSVYVPGSNLELNFAGYGRNPGGQVAFVEQSSNDANAGFLSANPAGSTSKITLGSLPTSLIVGGGNTAFTPQTSILVGSFGGARGNASTDFMTVQTFSNVNYVRPLRASEMNTSFNNLTINASNLPVSLPAAPTATWNQVVQLSTNLAFNINANLAFNAIRFDGTSNIYIADDKKWILGGMGANANLGTIGFDGSGMMAFNSGAVSTFGGTMAFGAREAIMRVGGSTHSLRSVIEGTGGLSKSGGTRLDLMGQNTYTGGTWVHEGEIRGYTNTAFGIPGPNNEVMLNIANLGLQSGVVIGDGTPGGSSRLYVVGAGSSFNSYDQNNVWGGDVFISATNAGGQSGQNVTFRAVGNSILTINGMVTGAGEDTARSLYENNPTQNFTGSGQGLILENNLSGIGGGIMFLNGAVSDREGAAAAGTGIPPSPGIPAVSAEHEKLNLFVRGFTGQASATNSDFVVNIKDASKVNGRIDLRSGLMFIGSDYGTGGRGDYVRGALIRLSDGGNVDRAGIMAGLLMTEPDTVFRGNDVQIGVNDGSHSSNAMALLGGLNRTGRVIIGSDRGTLDLNPIAGASQFTSASTAEAVSGANTLTLNTANIGVAAHIRVGHGISGPGIVPGTIVTAVSGNVITLSQATNATAGSGTSYTLGYFPSATNIAATSTNVEAIAVNATSIKLASVTGFVSGQGISGPGLPAGTRILSVDTVNNIVNLQLQDSGGGTTASGTLGAAYSAYTVGNTMTLHFTSGLKVGMGVVATGVPNGATITAINGNIISLSTPLNNAVPLGTSLSFPITRVNYQTVNATTGGVNTSSGSVVQLFSVAGLSVGSTVQGTGVATGTVIQSINPANNQITLSRPLTANNPNVSLAMMKSSNFVESRVYAAPGGIVDFRMRVIDDGGFGLNNEMGGLTKVGRGTVELSGSAAGGSDLDGGINLFGGTLVFDYVNLQNEGGVGLARDNSRVSQGGATLPYQFTMGGGTLLLKDGDTAGINESMRGTLTVRAGNSAIIGQAGNSSALRLNLGYHNPFKLGDDARHYWRSPDRFAGGTFQVEYGNLVDLSQPIPLGGSVKVYYSQNAPTGQITGTLGADAIIPYATMKITDPFIGEIVDFSSFVLEGTGSGLSDTLFADSSGFISVQNLFDPFGQGVTANVSNWNTDLDFGYGYMADDQLTQSLGTGFTGTLTPNSGGDFLGARVIRFTANENNNTLNLGTSRLVLGTASPTDFLLFGAPVEDGGAILVSNLVSIDTSLAPSNSLRVKPTNQFISGGTLTSAMASTYFSVSVMPGPLTSQSKPAATSTDLILHNYNDHGVFTIQSQIVNFQPTTPLNLVVSGTGTTKLAPSAGAGNLFTGAVFINDGTLWVANTSALGAAASTAMIYMNGGVLEIADTANANRATLGLSRTLPTTRPIVIGGDGATIRTTAPGTVVTYAGIVRSEDNIIPLNLSEQQYKENMGVGDLIKTGAGRLILSNSTAVNAPGWNAYFGVTEVLGGTLQLDITLANSGILGSHYAHLDGTRIEAGSRLEMNISGATFGSSEWFDLAGGVLGTGSTHTDGVLDGVIRFSSNSEINVSQGNLRMNITAGTLEGTGKLTKTGAGSLWLYENNANFSGDIEVRNGLLIGASQGLPFGAGSTIDLGDETFFASGTAGLLTQNRTTDGIFRSTYTVPQNIIVRTEGGPLQQTKVLGAVNVAGTGVQNDLHRFGGNIALLDDLTLRYQDDATNTRLNPNTPNGGATTGNLFGGNRTIALTGNLSGGRNLQTEIIQTGGTVNSTDFDQIITFELGGNNSAWTGAVRMGNIVVDADRQHILRTMSAQALGANNNVTMDFNSALQVAGQTLSIRNLFVGLPTGSATTNGVFVENAANAPGTLVVNQTTNETWDVIFRNGVTPTIHNAFDASTRDNVLNLVKNGSGTATLTQTNSYSGFTHVGSANGASGGILRIATGGSINPLSPLTVFAGAFELSGAGQTLNEIVTLGGGAAATRAFIRTGASTLTINNNVVFNATNNPAGAEISGTVQMGAAPRTFTVEDSIGAAIDLDVRANLLGTGGIIKTGPGTLALGGANNFTGGVAVNQGLLLATNTSESATGLGAVTVAGGAALGGIGTISGAVTLTTSVFGNEAVLTPGSPIISSGIELLNLAGVLTLGEFSIVDFFLGQTGYTQLNVGTMGSVASSTRFRLNLQDGYVPTAGASFNLLDWTTNLGQGDTNWLDNLILPSGPSWFTADFNTTGVISVAGVAQPVSFLTHPQAPALPVNPGDSVTLFVTLTGTEPWLLQWKKDNVAIPGATGLSYNIPFALEVDQANYSVEVTNGIATIFSNSTTLVVNDAPVITGQPTGGQVNPGVTFSFSVVAQGATFFQWKLNGDDIPLATEATYTIDSVTEANQGTYTVVAGNPAGSITSDPVEFIVNDPVVILTHPVDKFVPLGTPVTFEVVATGTGPLAYQWRRNGTNIDGANQPTLSLVTASNNLGSYTVRISNIVNPAPGGIISNAAVLTEVAAPVSIVTQPTPQLVPVGGTLTLNCQAVGALPLRFQWRRNGVNVAGATSSTLTVSNVATSRAGIYTCFVSNVTGGGPSNETSQPVDVGVVNTAGRTLILREGTSSTLTISAAGNVSYQWYKNAGAGEVELDGAVGSSLALPSLTLADKANYYCRVTLVGTGLTLDGGMNDVTIFNAAPDIDDSPWNFPDTIVSELYAFRIPLVEGTTPGVPDPAKTPTRYVASGLPPGLTIDNFGWVRGRATAVRYHPKGHPQEGQVAPYLVTITASNAINKDVVTQKQLIVNPLPGGVVGVFTGLIARNRVLTEGTAGGMFGLGGQIDVTTTARGTYSGKVLLGVKTYSFKGALNSNVASPNQSSVSVTISRGKTLAPLTLSFTLDATDDLLKLGAITDGTETAAISGWRNKWVRTATLPLPAAAYQGYYTLGLDIPQILSTTAANPGIPQGSGYASFTVNGGTARLTVSGRTPDGTAFSSATFVGPTGQVMVYRSLYAANARGSVLGQLTLSAASSNADNGLAGTLSWWRPATPGTTARLYSAGFDPFNLAATGSRYDPPVSPGLVMNIATQSPGVANANVTFGQANVENALPVPTFVSVNVASNHRVTAVSANPRRVTLLITPRTGVISGSFSLSEAHPDAANGGRPAVVNRTVSYLGLIVKDGVGIQGVGYFLLPQLPATKDIPATTTPILSGQVYFDRL
jgi:autotransporter-associated beta strand protein